MTFLIDGYNLMHAIGFLRQGLPAGGLERARLRFLNWLADETKERAVLLRVVFDARESRYSPERNHRGIVVTFAVGKTADDEIEEYLDAASVTKRLTVVSNDTRLQAAGRHSGSSVFTCQQFVDWLITVEKKAETPPPAADKPEPTATAEEMAAWLDVFSTPKKKRRA